MNISLKKHQKMEIASIAMIRARRSRQLPLIHNIKQYCSYILKYIDAVLQFLILYIKLYVIQFN